MKLESKLGISTSILILALLLSALTATLRIEQAKRLSDHIVEERIPFVLSLHNLRGHTRNSLLELQFSMIFGAGSTAHLAFRPEQSQTTEALHSDVAQIRERGNRLEIGAEHNKLETELTQVDELQSQEQQARTFSSLGTVESAQQARAILESNVLPLIASIYESSGGLIDSQESLEKREFSTLQRANDSVYWTLWTVTILGTLFGSLVAIWVTRHLTQSIDVLAVRAKAIASGDLTGSDLGIHSSDQIGSLAGAMQQMQTGLAAIIGTVVNTAGSLTVSAVSMHNASDQIHRRIDQQSQQTQQAATAMQEMSASIAEVSRHTQSAADTARSAAQTAHEGGDIVKQMLGSMHSIASAVSETSSTVGLLGEDSRRISQIVTVIDEIARKTNLLALNAAIEAARAGEQGRGFAVVAGEVRRLAESTAQATGEISTMIQGIQDRTKVAVASMASGTQIVEQGVITTNRAGEALERIIGMAERVDRMITQIAIAASQQAAASDQSSASLDAIHSLSHENLSEMATTAAGIETLRSTAASLKKQVESFQFDAYPGVRRAKSGATAEPILLRSSSPTGRRVLSPAVPKKAERKTA